jgi:regulator of replication initiation timing
MSILETAKDVITLVQKADNLELVKQVLALQTDIMKMMDENRALKDENRSLREDLNVRRRLVFRNNAYWLPAEDGSEEGPFCATCRDGDNKLVRMSQSASTGGFLCRVCLLKQKRK